MTFRAAQGGVPVVGGSLGLVPCLSACYWYKSTNTDTFGAAQGGVPVVGGELGLVQCLSAVHPRPLSICNAGRDPRCPPPAAS
jgi:hypothetical protein